MRITTKLVKSFKPCQDRFNNYELNYPNSDLNIIDFLKLDKITYDDKMWVWKKVATINEAVLFGLKCAESVLHIFESKYPKDNRPRLALESVKNYLDNPTEENRKICSTAVYATDAAVYATDAAVYATDAAADSAAVYDTDAAAYAAYVAVYATDAAAADSAAAYAVASAGSAAAYSVAAADAIAAGKTQQDKNIQFLIEVYEG